MTRLARACGEVVDVSPTSSCLRLFVLALGCLLGACSGGADNSEDSGGGHFPTTPGCQPGEGASGSPRSVGEVVQLINSLPRPVSLACFVESLDRPLRIEAAVSTISAQLSDGARSPRIFLFSGPLVMTLSPDGLGSDLLEMGEQVDGARSLKAELAFPVEQTLTDDDPYEKILLQDGTLTSCAFCHADERSAEGPPGRFISEALRPHDRSLVPLDYLVREYQDCDAKSEPARCEFFRALFGQGSVTHQPFPADFPTL